MGRVNGLRERQAARAQRVSSQRQLTVEQFLELKRGEEEARAARRASERDVWPVRREPLLVVPRSRLLQVDEHLTGRRVTATEGRLKSDRTESRRDEEISDLRRKGELRLRSPFP